MYWFLTDEHDEKTIGIGVSSNCSIEFCNKPLYANTEYFLIVRALTSSTYRDSLPLNFTTGKLLSLFYCSNNFFNFTEPLDEINLGLILGLIFGIIALVMIAIFIVILWKRRKGSVQLSLH